MSYKTLIARLIELEKTKDFQQPIAPLSQRLKEVDKAFELGYEHFALFHKIGESAITAMETAIEVLYRCGDFEEAAKYTRIYINLIQQSNALQN